MAKLSRNFERKNEKVSNIKKYQISKSIKYQKVSNIKKYQISKCIKYQKVSNIKMYQISKGIKYQKVSNIKKYQISKWGQFKGPNKQSREEKSEVEDTRLFTNDPDNHQ